MPHWKNLASYEYLGAYSLDKGQELIVTIKAVKKQLVTSEGGKTENCIVVYFEEPNIKPFVCNKTNCKTISAIYHSPFIEDWIGKKIQLFVTTTKFKGEIVECLRVRDFVPLDKVTYNCSVCGKEVEENIALGSSKKYGAIYCSKECVDKGKDIAVNGKNYV